MKICIVTGSAGQIGLNIAISLRKNGYLVYGIDLIESPVASVFEHYEKKDITKIENLQYLFDLAVSKSNDISIVNNAGITLNSTNENFIQYWQDTIAVNLTAPYLLLELYKKNVEKGLIKAGAIVNIGSLSAHRGFGDNPAYVASKTGLIGLTRAYADILGPYNIRVNSVSPGYIRSSMTLKSQQDPNRFETIRNLSMLKSWGEPNEVAAAVEFLLSESSKFITGVDLPVDGGWLNKGSFT
jgi:NAD(P)-dependent dehydrogenase (short-subunit alcohol dehydrogenase family)